MASDARKWIPPALIAAAMVLTTAAVRELPPTVTIDLRGLLPFEVEPRPDTAPRWMAVVLIPLIAAAMWSLLELARSRPGLRITKRLFARAPEVLADPASIERFRGTYDTIVLAVVVLILGVHAGMVAAMLGHDTLAPRIINVVLGMSLAVAGNVMPRLRPNLVAGVRTSRTLNDPHLWRATHRLLGIAFVIAGAVTAVVGVIAPEFGLLTAVVGLLVACLVAAIGGVRATTSTA
jgi:uncharacterized membrane protein